MTNDWAWGFSAFRLGVGIAPGGRSKTALPSGCGLAAAAAGSATSLRAYKSHEDARTKLSKNSSLGTQYHLKGDSTTVYDLSQNLQDVAKKKRK